MNDKVLLLKNSLIINDDLAEYADAYVFPIHPRHQHV